MRELGRDKVMREDFSLALYVDFLLILLKFLLQLEKQMK